MEKESIYSTNQSFLSIYQKQGILKVLRVYTCAQIIKNNLIFY